MSGDTTAAIGIDLGGTKTTAGLVSVEGQVLYSATSSTPARAGAEAILDTAAALARRLLEQAEDSGIRVGGIGLGAAGVIDPVTACVISATAHLAGWGGTDLRSGLARRVGGTVQISAVNDVHAHALGETWLGAARGASSAVLIAFGTGIGGSLVIGPSAPDTCLGGIRAAGRPHFGARNVAGHFGHVSSPAAVGLSCACGGSGHLEAIASGPALHALFLRLGGDTTVTDARAVFRRAHEGDATAQAAITTAARAAGTALGGFANCLDPEVLVLSGGLAASGPLWWDPLREAFAEELIPALRRLEPTPSALGADGAVIGAASLILHAEQPVPAGRTDLQGA